MLEKYVIDFIDGKINMEMFQSLCKDTFYKYISDNDLLFSLDAIKYLPFIHYFSFPEYGVSIDEYKSEVQDYLKLLHHEVEYHYSCVILLPQLKRDDSIDIHDASFIEKVVDIFREEKDSNESISDILYNMLRELISNNQDDCFGYLNCSNDLSTAYLKEKIIQLYMYYTGTKEFIVQLFCNKAGRDVYCII